MLRLAELSPDKQMLEPPRFSICEDTGSGIVSIVRVPGDEASPVATDGYAEVTATSVDLHLTVDPNGLETDLWFDSEASDSTPNTDTDITSFHQERAPAPR